MHTCPRRFEVPHQLAPDQDDYLPGHGPVGQERGCSYCGSMHPEDFLSKVKEGWIVGPTDKHYKAYLTPPQGVNGQVGKFYYQHLSVEQRDEFIELHNDKTMKIGYPGYFYVKPFFVTTK